MTRQVDVEPLEIRVSPADESAERRRAARGCALALVAGPVLGALVYAWTDELLASSLIAFAALVGLGVRAVLRMRQAAPVARGTATWAFTPLGCAVIAGTDVLATGSDLTPATYLLLTVPASFAVGAVVLWSELRESGRPLLAAVKAGAAVALVLVPMPVGGLLGAGASMGHRMLRPPGAPPSPRDRGGPSSRDAAGP